MREVKLEQNNNFHFLRFLFALFVVISHCYPLSGSIENQQWIYVVSKGQTVLARLGLNGFFVISGFFIFKSAIRSDSLLNYFKNRVLRLYPALIVVLILSVLLGYFIYDSAVPYLKNKSVLTYILNNLSLYNFQGVINGIFDKNHYHAINGSLWTIRYEFTLYVLVSVFYFFKNKKKIKQILLLCCAFLALLFYHVLLPKFSETSILGMNFYQLLDLGGFFVIGSLLSVFNFEKVGFTKQFFFIALIILACSFYFEFYNEVKHVAFSILVLSFGYLKLPILNKFGVVGDLSYGIYIYSFPIQQFLMYFFKFNLNQLIVWSVFLSIIFGFLSWHLIEKHALKLKRTSFNN